MIRIPRSQYAELYGPTTGDRIRLADTELWIEIERDHTVYGDEVCFGGGKVIRDGMPSGLLMSEQILARNFTGAAPAEQVSPPVASRTRSLMRRSSSSSEPNRRSRPVAST